MAEPPFFPQAASGRVALLMLGFTYDSRFQVEAWAKRFRQDFGTEPSVTFFEIPMIGGLARMGKWFIDSGMRRGTPKADHENVITVYGGTDAWKQRVGFRDPQGRVSDIDRSRRPSCLALRGKSRRGALQGALIGGVETSLRELSTDGRYTLYRELWVPHPLPRSSISSPARRIWNKSLRHGCASGFSLRRPS